MILGGRVVAMRAIASYGVASLDVLWKCAAVSRQEHKKQQQQTDEHTVSSGTQVFALFWGYACACWVWVGWVYVLVRTWRRRRGDLRQPALARDTRPVQARAICRARW